MSEYFVARYASGFDNPDQECVERANVAKHGISFEEAQDAFLDASGRLTDDPDHSEAESRFLPLGYGAKARCLVVSH